MTTLRELYIKRLGKRKFKSLSREWKEHIRRIDSLPKPVAPSKQQPPHNLKSQ